MQSLDSGGMLKLWTISAKHGSCFFGGEFFVVLFSRGGGGERFE